MKRVFEDLGGQLKTTFRLYVVKVFVYSWGLGIWVSSTSFQKNNIGWPQQPPTLECSWFCQIDLSGLCSLTGLNSLYIHIFSKNFLVWSSLAPKWPILVISCRIDHKKSNFLLICMWYFFLSEAVEASPCYFFENWLMQLKCPNLRNIDIPSL